jgi:segregation and condensation protein B
MSELEIELMADSGGGGLDSAELPPLRAALEAILLVVEEPVDEGVLAQVLERPREEIAATLAELAAEYDADGRGFELRGIAGGWRLYTRPDCAPYVERFVRDGQPAKLSQAALETLAVIAYRQPTTRSRIAGVRGVNVDAVIRTLLTRGLIAEVGIERETGAILYGTTEHFLERLGLASTEDLPPLAEYLPDHTALDDDAAAG